MNLLNHPAPAFWCVNNTDRTDRREYLVPVKHIRYEPLASRRHQELEERIGTSSTAGQITAFYAEHDGASLFVGPRDDIGAVILLPFDDWAERHEQASTWLEDEMEYYGGEEALGLPFTVEKLLAIGARNWSPDTWFLATDGPGAGKVYFWGHDGAPLTGHPYSHDFSGFIVRLFREAPECCGGLARFGGSDAVGEPPPPGTELYPRRYVADWHHELSHGGR
jgi:hypothetical protein